MGLLTKWVDLDNVMTKLRMFIHKFFVDEFIIFISI